MTVLQEKSIFLILRDVDFLNFLPKILFLKWKLFAWHMLCIPLFYIHTIDLNLAVDLALAINLGQWLSVWTLTASLREDNYLWVLFFLFIAVENGMLEE